MNRPLLFTCAAAVTLFAASAAEAGRVSWSIGIDVAPASTYVSSGPGWYPGPAVYAPPRVVYAPVPAYVPRPVYWQPQPIYYDAPAYAEPYELPTVAVYAAPAPVYVVPRRHWGLPPLPPLPRAPWDHHDRWHHEVAYRR